MAGMDGQQLLLWVAMDEAEALAAASFDDADLVQLATVAVQKGHAASTRVLLRQGKLEQQTLAYLAGIAILLGHVPVLREIADAAPSAVSDPDRDGKTTAFLAASVGNVEALTVIAEVAPVALGLPITGGVTPIDVAWHRGHQACVEFLRSCGIPDPMERWQTCCDGEPCGPKPMRDADSVIS